MAIFVVSSASGQTYIFGRADFPSGIGPESAIVADFNGDGKPDLAVANSGENTVSILLGKTGGSFVPRTDFPTGKTPVSVVAGDFNGDGKLDLAVANSSELSVSILLGNGDGSFQPAATFPTRNPPHRVLIGDFNGDGKLDIATVNSTFVTGTANNSVSILLGIGDGTFLPFIDYPMDGGTFSIASGDFNGDGKMDLAVGNPGLMVVSVLLGNGDGTFQQPVDYGSGTGEYVASYLITRDFNRDGILDLASCGGGKVSILLGNGDGTFQAHVDYAGVGSDVGWMTADDFNRDGKLDLAVSNGYGGGPPLPTVSILVGNGDGTFQAPVNYNTGGQPFSVASGDVNGDGNADLVMATEGNFVTVLIGRGDGTFPTSSDYIGASVPMSVTAGDFNGDGKLDLATPNRADNTVSVFLARGDGTFQPAASYAGGPTPRAVIAADLNGDGKEDLIVADPSCALIFPPCPTTGSISILLAKSDGTFQLPVSYPVNGYPVSVAVGDFNVDGKIDVVAANGNYPGTVSVLLGKGDGTFQTPVDYATGQAPDAVAVGDFNADGKPDLAVATSGGFTGAVSILLGRGDGTFQSHVDYPVDQGPVSIVTADFNKDGKPDLAVANNSDASISVLLGNGDGTFQSRSTYRPTHPNLTGLATGDFNGDGIPDLAVVNNFDNAISLLIGKGDGTFPTTIDYEYSAGGSSFGLAAADLRGDGGFDLAIANFSGGGGNSISVLLNSPVVALSPAQVFFGSLDVGESSNPQIVQLTNVGGVPLGIHGEVVTGDFAETNDCNSKLAVGANCSVNISFAPTYPGTRNGTVVITDSAVNSPQTITLNGTGIGPAVGLSPTSSTFGGQLITTTSPPQMVTLTNIGNALLTTTGFAISGDYAQTNDCSSTVAANASCSIKITFLPTAAGSRNGTLTITDNAPGSPHVVPLSGTGTDFKLAVAAGGSSAMSVPAGQTATFKLEVDPLDEFDGTVQLTCNGGPALANGCSVSPSSVTLLGTDAAPFTLTVHSMSSANLTPPLRLPRITWPPLLLILSGVAGWIVLMRNQREKHRLQLQFAILLLGAIIGGSLLTGCGGSSSKPPTTYTITVTGASNGVSRTLPLTLTVSN